MEKDLVLVIFNGMMVHITKETGWEIRQMVKVNWSYQMEINIQVYGKILEQMDSVIIYRNLYI